MRWLLALTLLQELPAPKFQRAAPEQPLPFSHKKHAGELKLACKQCHPNPDPGDFAGIPQPATCMTCHSKVRTDSPHIQKLSAFHSEGKKVPWARVYRIPDYVLFSHRVHVEKAAVTCESCHGPVREREALRREKDLSMAACMDCHRSRNASNACDYCHDPK